MKRIKWENILTIIFGALFIMAIIKHNGTIVNTLQEVIIYGGFLVVVRYSIKKIRLGE